MRRLRHQVQLAGVKGHPLLWLLVLPLFAAGLFRTAFDWLKELDREVVQHATATVVAYATFWAALGVRLCLGRGACRPPVVEDVQAPAGVCRRLMPTLRLRPPRHPRPLLRVRHGGGRRSGGGVPRRTPGLTARPVIGC